MPERGGFFRRLRDNMSKTRQAFGAELQTTVFQSLDDEAFERLEETLIYADVGAPTTAKIVERLETEAESGELTGRRGAVAPAARAARRHGARGGRHDPAHRASDGDPRDRRERQRQDDHDREDGLAPAEGARAARCCSRPATPSARPPPSSSSSGPSAPGARSCAARPGSDPGAVVFDAIEAAQARGHDVVIVDTAGRLHTQQHLMDELRKVRKVIERQAPGAPHETLLTIDATTGQNGLRQALLFREAVDVTGIVLTKLDGTAKGGIALAIAQELGVPVKLIGIGEALEDLRPFDPDDFAQAILEP